MILERAQLTLAALTIACVLVFSARTPAAETAAPAQLVTESTEPMDSPLGSQELSLMARHLGLTDEQLALLSEIENTYRTQLADLLRRERETDTASDELNAERTELLKQRIEHVRSILTDEQRQQLVELRQVFATNPRTVLLSGYMQRLDERLGLSADQQMLIRPLMSDYVDMLITMRDSPRSRRVDPAQAMIDLQRKRKRIDRKIEKHLSDVQRESYRAYREEELDALMSAISARQQRY